MDGPVERLAQVDDSDIDQLPFFLRWPVQMLLGFFLSSLVNGFALAIGTVIGLGAHGQVSGSTGLAFQAGTLLRSDIGQHFEGFAAEAVVCLVVWLLANVSLQFGIRHNAGSRVAAAIPGGLLGLAWTGWFALALGASWLAS